MYCKRENSRIFKIKTLSGERVTPYGYKSDILAVLLKAKFFTKFFTLSPAGVCLGLRGSQREGTFSAKRGKFPRVVTLHVPVSGYPNHPQLQILSPKYISPPSAPLHSCCHHPWCQSAPPSSLRRGFPTRPLTLVLATCSLQNDLSERQNRSYSSSTYKASIGSHCSLGKISNPRRGQCLCDLSPVLLSHPPIPSSLCAAHTGLPSGFLTLPHMPFTSLPLPLPTLFLAFVLNVTYSSKGHLFRETGWLYWLSDCLQLWS